jgi:hypothetical protein
MRSSFPQTRLFWLDPRNPSHYGLLLITATPDE